VVTSPFDDLILTGSARAMLILVMSRAMTREEIVSTTGNRSCDVTAGMLLLASVVDVGQVHKRGAALSWFL
jgi:hypothetical protein